MQVNFLVIGAQKAGTTTLHHYLSQHPQLHLPKVKELHFFDNDILYAKNPIDYNIYHKHFDLNLKVKLRGEVTPIYMYWEPCAKRMHSYNPNLKLIMILRNPIERAFSHWNMEMNRGAEKLSFFEALKCEEAANKKYLSQDRVRSYLDRGFYSKQIERLYKYFPKKNVLILKSEDLNSSYIATLNKVAQFLGVKSFSSSIKHNLIHVGDYKQSIDKKSYTYLKHAYLQELINLESLLGWNLTHWR